MIRSISCCQDFRNIEKTIQIDNGNVCASIGKSSYLVGASLETGHDNGHIFVGNYSSLAHGLIFVIGLDHAFRITTYPLEQIGLSASEAYQVLSKKDTLRLGRDQIIIGNDVWIGRGATIMGGVHIGNGAVIGAEAVVAKDIPPYAVVVGNPAKVIRYRFRPEIIAKLQRIKWWYWPEHKLAMVKEYADDIEGFVHRFYDETGLSQGVLETEESEQLAGLKQSGYTIMYLTLKKEKELSAQSKNILQQYFEHYAIHDRVVLVLETPAGHRGKRINMAIDTFLKEYSADTMPLLITHDAKLMEDVPEAILSHIDYLITTKEQFMLKYADYAMEYGAKTLYGIGKRIFGAIVLPDREA